jgi:hypothetical protein
VLDDAKVPDTPFMLKCPKCQATVKLPGKSGNGEAPQPAAASAPPAPSAPPPSSSAIAPPAPVRPPSAPQIGTALVSVPTSEQAESLGTMLGKLGFASEGLDPQLEEKILKLQQGEYAVVATTRNGVPEEKNLYRIVCSLSPEIRRRVFLVLVGDEFKSGEGTQAFAVLADLVIQSSDAATAERLVARTMIERRRVYQTFWDAEDRRAEGKL